MTVVKRQAQSPSGVSSEVEVLKALKSLFEHHKALDEKVRERLRVSLERVSALEEELTAANQEIVALREQNAHLQRKVASGEGGDDLLEGSEAQQKVHTKRLSNGSLESAREASQVVELQDLLEKQNYELAQMKERMSSLSSRVSEVEQELETARKDLIKSEEMNNKYQRDIKEVMCQKEDMEERIVTLEKRYLSAQREATSVHDINDKLENELANKEAFLRQMEEKNRQLQERLELAEQKLQQTMRKAETLPEVEAELAQRIAALTKAEERHGSIEERMRHLECQLEEKNQELLRARQREKMNEEHNKRLSDTVDRLLTESNERLQLHLKERMAALEEKNMLIQDSEGYRKQYEESLQEKSQLADEIDKLRSELDQYRLRAGSLTEPTLSRSHLDTSAELRFSLGSLAETQSDHYRSAKVIRRPRRGRIGLRETKAKSLGEHEWRSQQLGVLGGHHFESDTEMSDIDDDDRETLFSSMDLLSPSGHSDAQTLAMMLQEQLDAINKEIRYLTSLYKFCIKRRSFRTLSGFGGVCMVRVCGLAGVGLGGGLVSASGWVLVLALWALLPFVRLGVGLLVGLILAGHGCRACSRTWMLRVFFSWGCTFTGSFVFGGLVGDAFAQCELCVQLLLWVLFAAFRPPLYGVLWCWGDGPGRGGSDLRAWCGRAGVN
ncbi:Liprin-alpha-2 [Characodon lateralis]|uniref:Liprin-alpha-2 n=1 Tax=Characodon lateralis TaxID=208331 RepID=A0ABU7F2G7_9TELE|nr:Liprin-alpha-2 [Characodon lateralis]